MIEIVRGAMADAPEAEFVAAYCRSRPREAAQLVHACAAALTSAKTTKHEHQFKEDARVLVFAVAGKPLLRTLAVRLIEADIEADDEIRHCVPAATWARRSAWLRDAVAGELS